MPVMSKDDRIDVRISEDDRKLLRKVKRSLDDGSLSQWIREVVREAAKKHIARLTCPDN